MIENNDVFADLKKMKPKIQEGNQVFCLTPENKIKKWSKLIKDLAIKGNKVKIYSDIESTGFAFWQRGRATFDEAIDEMSLIKDSQNFNIQIELIKEKENYPVDLSHPLCYSKMFLMNAPSSFSIVLLGLNILKNKNIDCSDILNSLNDNTLNKSYYDDLLNSSLLIRYKEELTKNAKNEIKLINRRAYNHLKKEAIKLSGCVDRMIEYAFVTCYENEDGETFLLKDEDGDLIFFHEFIYPNEDGMVKENQIIEEMPLIPYIIHKTDFDFLKGEKEHPFLNIKLNKKASSSKEVLGILIEMLEHEGTKEEKIKIAENVMMFFHNGNGFDVPFIDAEMNRFYEGKKLRDFFQTYDTLKIAKAIVPSDVQKFIANCQYNKDFGGDESIKTEETIAIAPTSKSLDNIKRLATFLIDFDPEKPKLIYEKAQEFFFNKFKNIWESQNIDWKKYENMLEYSSHKNSDIVLTKGFPKPKLNQKEYLDIMTRYNKMLDAKKEYVQSLNKVKVFENVYKNIQNLRKNIEENKFLNDALLRLNNIDRSAHGARVDSQLFMDAFIVLENSLYLKPKISHREKIKRETAKIPEEIMKNLEKIKREM